jgi:hypothetical protein
MTSRFASPRQKASSTKTYHSVQDSATRLISVVTFLFYPAMSLVILRSFQCTEYLKPDGTAAMWLDDDMLRQCSVTEDAQYAVIWGVAVIMTVVVVAGLPISMVGYMWRMRYPVNRLYNLSEKGTMYPSPGAISTVGDRFANFVPAHWYYASVLMVRKLLLTSMINIMFATQPSLGAQVSAIFSFGIAASTVGVRPYAYPGANELESLCHLVLGVSFLVRAADLTNPDHRNLQRSTVLGIQFFPIFLGVCSMLGLTDWCSRKALHCRVVCCNNCCLGSSIGHYDETDELEGSLFGDGKERLSILQVRKQKKEQKQRETARRRKMMGKDKWRDPKTRHSPGWNAMYKTALLVQRGTVESRHGHARALAVRTLEVAMVALVHDALIRYEAVIGLKPLQRRTASQQKVDDAAAVFAKLLALVHSDDFHATEVLHPWHNAPSSAHACRSTDHISWDYLIDVEDAAWDMYSNMRVAMQEHGWVVGSKTGRGRRQSPASARGADVVPKKQTRIISMKGALGMTLDKQPGKSNKLTKGVLTRQITSVGSWRAEHDQCSATRTTIHLHSKNLDEWEKDGVGILARRLAKQIRPRPPSMLLLQQCFRATSLLVLRSGKVSRPSARERALNMFLGTSFAKTDLGKVPVLDAIIDSYVVGQADHIGRLQRIIKLNKEKLMGYSAWNAVVAKKVEEKVEENVEEKRGLGGRNEMGSRQQASAKLVSPAHRDRREDALSDVSGNGMPVDDHLGHVHVWVDPSRNNGQPLYGHDHEFSEDSDI